MPPPFFWRSVSPPSPPCCAGHDPKKLGAIQGDICLLWLATKRCGLQPKWSGDATPHRAWFHVEANPSLFGVPIPAFGVLVLFLSVSIGSLSVSVFAFFFPPLWGLVLHLWNGARGGLGSRLFFSSPELLYWGVL